MNRFATPDDIRLAFSEALSSMYRTEVPLYGDLLELVATSNAHVLDSDSALRASLAARSQLERLNAERHGAIRVGTPKELAVMRRLFAVMGMVPVGYYDLAPAGLPVHSTAFRTTDSGALDRCAFRIFCSMLRIDLIEDKALRKKADEILSERRIATDDLLKLIIKFEYDGRLSSHDSEALIGEALKTFRWHREALVDHSTYSAFANSHPLIADIVCFRGPHINHLTPRALDIDHAQAEMIAHNIPVKTVIEGPPRRNVPILLRQTSFQALKETILFREGDSMIPDTHTARFGEIEQRGIALTPLGRKLYDAALTEADPYRAEGGARYEAKLAAAFTQFPDDMDEMRRQDLTYCTYELTAEGSRLYATNSLPRRSRNDLVDYGLVHAIPITYEDFLPVSAAGIFQSNLSGQHESQGATRAAQGEFEAALGAICLNPFDLYRNQERRSLDVLNQSICTDEGA